MSHYFPFNTRFQSLTSTPKLPGKDFADDLPSLVPEVWLTPRYGHVKRTDRRIQLELDRARYVSQMPRLIEVFSLYVPISKMRIALCRLLKCLAAFLSKYFRPLYCREVATPILSKLSHKKSAFHTWIAGQDLRLQLLSPVLFK